MGKTDNEKDFFKTMLNKYYDIEIFINKSDINLHPNHFKAASTKKYKHIKLVNVNGHGIGQLHFINGDGSYLLIPWGYILTMVPNDNNIISNESEKEDD